MTKASERTSGRANSVDAARGMLRPLHTSDVTITSGLLSQWQRRNTGSTIPHSITELRKAGNLENLRAVTDPDAVGHKGSYPFLDTDIYKTLEGLAYELARAEYQAEDPAVRAFYEEAVELIVQTQAPDGYLNSFFQNPTVPKVPWEDMAWGHELYNLGHLIQAAVAAQRQLGDRRLLDVACRFADLVTLKFGDAGKHEVCGHPEVEMALVELYRETGNQSYLTQASLFVERRGRGLVRLSNFTAEYFQDNFPFRELPSVTGHAVRMGYLAAGATDVYLEAGDKTLLDALERLWDDMVASKLYITGGLGSRHSDEAIGDRFELPSERSYSETCAAISIMQWGWRMFLATGQAKYIDVFETILYNAYAVGLSADGTKFFYDNPLQRRQDHEQRSGAETGGDLLRRSWFGCPCCPPNVTRWMSELQDYLAATSNDSLKLANYATATLTTEEVSVELSTDYPWDGDIRAVVTQAPANEYTLSFRVPGWAKGATVSINGDDGAVAAPGWVDLRRHWTPGDEVRLVLPMEVRAHVSHPYVDGTRGSAAVARGPLVYCAEQQDNETPIDDLILSEDGLERAATGSRQLLAGAHGEAVVITMPAQVADAPAGKLYPLLGEDRGASSSTCTASLIPYFLWGNRSVAPMRVWLRTF